MADLQAQGGDHRYRLLKVALERFGCEPGALDETQAKQASRIVGRQVQIEDAVLRSPQATGVVIPESQVEAAWQQVVGRYDDLQALHQALEAQSLDEAHVRGVLARELKVEAILERVGTGAPAISDTDVSLYYFSHPEQFVRPETRRARHILITLTDDFAENTREAAQARLTAIAQRLASKPERFAEQAMKHSECPTSLQGGLLGEVRRGVLYPALEDCLFALEAGQLSPIVESPLGLHLLLCEAIADGGQLTLEEVLPRLRERLEERQRQARQRQWLAALLTPSAPEEEPAHG